MQTCNAINVTSADQVISDTNQYLQKVIAISIQMRERTYTMAKTRTPAKLKVIVIFGAGNFAEWRQLMSGAFSYIAIDPVINTDWLFTKATGLNIQPYDFSTGFESQLVSIAGNLSTVLWAKCTTEHFLEKTMAAAIMGSLRIPAVFSFSVSYHIPVINILYSNKVPVFGCGYIHDNLPLEGVGQEPATMRLEEKSSHRVISIFGTSIFKEPFLSKNAVPGIVFMKDAMPELWNEVDTDKVAIMERAVIMSA